MCAQSHEGLGVIVRCAWCKQLFVVCERCYHGQRLCSDRCKIANRQDQIRRARLAYARSNKGKRRRSRINQRYRMRRANKSDQIETDQSLTHHSDRGTGPPDVARAPVGSDVRAMEGPCHDVQLPMRDSSGTRASEDASEQAFDSECAQGGLHVHSTPAASRAHVAPGIGHVQRPSLEHCHLCGALVRWKLDRACVRRRAMARRKPDAPVRRRRPRQPIGPLQPQ